MKFPFFWKKQSIPTPKNDALSEFFHTASDEEKLRVFREAARLSNEDQRALVERARKLHAA